MRGPINRLLPNICAMSFIEEERGMLHTMESKLVIKGLTMTYLYELCTSSTPLEILTPPMVCLPFLYQMNTGSTSGCVYLLTDSIPFSETSFVFSPPGLNSQPPSLLGKG